MRSLLAAAALLPVVASLAATAAAQDVNVALAGTVTQSSTSGFLELPSYANDGNRDGYWFNNSSTCTANLPGAWIQVALASASPVHEVVLWNRGDCCPGRLSNFRVEVKNGSTVVFTQDILTTGGTIPAGDALRIKIPGSGVTATSVRLTNIGTNSEGSFYLHLSEFEVIRYGSGRTVNFARYGTASASSNPTQVARIVDGRIDGIAQNGSTFQSLNGAGQWLQVAMERHRVDRVQLWPVTLGNSTSQCGNFHLAVIDGGVEVWGVDVLPGAVMPINQPTVVTPPSGTFGDTIRLTTLGPVSGSEDLVLAELESLQFAGYLGEQWAYGAGCLGGAGVPRLTCAVRPATGANLVLRVTNVPAPGIGLLLTGQSNSDWSSLPLPLNLQTVGAPGCWLLASLDLSQGGIASNGTIDFPFPLPPTSLLGLRMFQQAALIDPAANTLQIVVSNALEQYVGF